MSFKCDWCDKTIWKTLHRVVTEKRNKIYNYQKIKYVRGERVIENLTSRGWEIAKELEVCDHCAKELKSQQEKVEIAK